MTTPYLNSNPAFAKQIAPWSQHIIDTAAKYGVPADFAFMTIKEESSGNPNAIGDNGQALGLWQVQHKFSKDWGINDPTKRTDPIAATSLIMPEIAKLLKNSNGSWAAATVAYNRSRALRDRLLKGESVDTLGLDKTGRKRYQIAKELQEKSNPSKVIQTVADNYLNKLPKPVVQPTVVQPTVIQPAVVQPSIYTPAAPAPVVIDTTISDYIKKLKEQKEIEVETALKAKRRANVGTNPKIDFVDDLSTVDYIE
jgi:Transglycosylase SLT domain